MTNNTAQPTILLIDDHEDSREVIGEWLRSEGWDVLELGRAESAVGIVERGEAVLVITDLTLPGMSGHELAKALRELPFGGQLPIVALTGRSDVPFGPGELFDELIIKPFDPEELVKAVARLLSPEERVSRTVSREGTPAPTQSIPRTSTS